MPQARRGERAEIKAGAFAAQLHGREAALLRRAAERKLLPACQHQVKDGMEVFTMNAEGADGERVRQTVKVLTELLAVDHLKDADSPKATALDKELTPFNELGCMVKRSSAASGARGLGF